MQKEYIQREFQAIPTSFDVSSFKPHSLALSKRDDGEERNDTQARISFSPQSGVLPDRDDGSIQNVGNCEVRSEAYLTVQDVSNENLSDFIPRSGVGSDRSEGETRNLSRARNRIDSDDPLEVPTPHPSPDVGYCAIHTQMLADSLDSDVSRERRAGLSELFPQRGNDGETSNASQVRNRVGLDESIIPRAASEEIGPKSCDGNISSAQTHRPDLHTDHQIEHLSVNVLLPVEENLSAEDEPAEWDFQNDSEKVSGFDSEDEKLERLWSFENEDGIELQSEPEDDDYDRGWFREADHDQGLEARNRKQWRDGSKSFRGEYCFVTTELPSALADIPDSDVDNDSIISEDSRVNRILRRTESEDETPSLRGVSWPAIRAALEAGSRDEAESREEAEPMDAANYYRRATPKEFCVFTATLGNFNGEKTRDEPKTDDSGLVDMARKVAKHTPSDLESVDGLLARLPQPGTPQEPRVGGSTDHAALFEPQNPEERHEAGHYGPLGSEAERATMEERRLQQAMHTINHLFDSPRTRNPSFDVMPGLTQTPSSASEDHYQHPFLYQVGHPTIQRYERDSRQRAIFEGSEDSVSDMKIEALQPPRDRIIDQSPSLTCEHQGAPCGQQEQGKGLAKSLTPEERCQEDARRRLSPTHNAKAAKPAETKRNRNRPKNYRKGNMVKVLKTALDDVDLKVLKKSAKETWKILQARNRKAKKAASEMNKPAAVQTKTGKRRGGYDCGDCGEPKGAGHDCIFVRVPLTELEYLVSQVHDDLVTEPLRKALERYRNQCRAIATASRQSRVHENEVAF